MTDVLICIYELLIYIAVSQVDNFFKEKSVKKQHFFFNVVLRTNSFV